MFIVKKYIKILKKIIWKIMNNVPYIERPLPKNPFVFNNNLSINKIFTAKQTGELLEIRRRIIQQDLLKYKKGKGQS